MKISIHYKCIPTCEHIISYYYRFLTNNCHRRIVKEIFTNQKIPSFQNANTCTLSPSSTSFDFHNSIYLKNTSFVLYIKNSDFIKTNFHHTWVNLLWQQNPPPRLINLVLYLTSMGNLHACLNGSNLILQYTLIGIDKMYSK